MVVVVDDESRENEGDLVMAAEKVTPEAINFMARYGRGLICLPIVGERLDELQIPIMVPAQGDHMGTAFTVSVDSRHCTTGISAPERAMTVKAVIDPATRPEDLVRPGHIFPLRAKEGGVLRRPGHTEAAVDLARMAGLYPAGVICEIMNEDGTMARLPQLAEFAREHGLKIITIEEVIKYRMRTDRLVRRIASAVLPTRYGDFQLHAYEDLLTGKCHVALVKGEIAGDEPVLVRVHSECLTGDTFGSLRCDCGEQLERAMHMVQEAGRGVVLYMRQEGRGIGLANKIRAYALQDAGLDTVEANVKLGFPPDARDYGTGAQVLADLGVRRMLLLTNNPRKYAALAGYGLEIVERVPIQVKPNRINARYLKAKREKLGHLLDGLDD
ncbi:MAG: bifunctional 3,4-dihydroxy-2-butanone-4-phosphate synthase/GTP cyclohydrolase II [Bacillota bacterium]|nr:bifunctional 3,4-dihydroxy-2-butanone-4-phosphate synthase/GTP cyclohydrolase II [Bacillota bacterium]